MDGTTRKTDGDLQEITTSVFSFEKLRGNDYLYVDKTAQIHSIFLRKEGQYFLARPRRFGKSLLISTLKAIFEGRKELFRELAIDSLGYHWTKYPVIHLDMGHRPAGTPELFVESLDCMLAEIIRKNHLDVDQTLSPPNQFASIVERMAEQSPTGKVVILVDEYDKPLLGHLGKSDVTRFKDLLRSFYSVIKGTEEIQHFALITGVSRFSKASIFSDLNNLTDLTMKASAATLLGYTHAELRGNFGGHVAAFAAAKGLTVEAAYAELEEWYDGYRFEENSETVFNPVSIGMCLTDRELGNFWFDTGTPTFLVDLLKANPIDLAGGIRLPAISFSAYEPEHPSLPALIHQTGYLTIKGFDEESGMPCYTLDLPNHEVRMAFSFFLASGLSGLDDENTNGVREAILADLADGDVDAALEDIKGFFSGVPYDIIEQKEKYHQLLFYAIFTLIGVKIQSEVRTSSGRIDAVLKTKKRIFVFEFKLNGTAEEALAQIRERKYCEKYRADGREIVRVGVEFDRETRNLGKWLAERVPAVPPKTSRP